MVSRCCGQDVVGSRNWGGGSWGRWFGLAGCCCWFLPRTPALLSSAVACMWSPPCAVRRRGECYPWVESPEQISQEKGKRRCPLGLPGSGWSHHKVGLLPIPPCHGCRRGDFRPLMVYKTYMCLGLILALCLGTNCSSSRGRS